MAVGRLWVQPAVCRHGENMLDVRFGVARGGVSEQGGRSDLEREDGLGER